MPLFEIGRNCGRRPINGEMGGSISLRLSRLCIWSYPGLFRIIYLSHFPRLFPYYSRNVGVGSSVLFFSIKLLSFLLFYSFFCRHLMVKDWARIERLLLEDDRKHIHLSQPFENLEGEVAGRTMTPEGGPVGEPREDVLRCCYIRLHATGTSKSSNMTNVSSFFSRIPRLPHQHPCRWWPISFESSTIHYISLFFFLLFSLLLEKSVDPMTRLSLAV